MAIDEAKAAAEVKGFPCESCGAQLTYAAGTSSLKCSNCGHLNQIQFERAAVAEYDLAQLEPATTNRGFGVETRSFKCSQCAATTSFPSGLTSTKCAFCGSAVVVQTPSSPDLVRPETLIPFQFDKNIAVQKFRAWLKGLWFRPSDLNKMAAVADISGAYTPFFTFDASALSDWTGEAGFYYYVQEQYYDAQAKQRPPQGILQ
jgi:LSD1 subclass zinc finger protein